MDESETAEMGENEREFHEAVAELEAPYREMGERVHEIVTENAPDLEPRTWYGMPAYERDGKTVCFFRVDGEYMTFGFTEKVDLTPDDSELHQLIPSSWFFTALDDATEDELAAIVRTIAN